MRIRSNVPALIAESDLNKNRTKLSKNLEKLSSGYKINRAGDDAAGLSVSEKMRMYITGTTGALGNAKQGIGLIQTGEGALQEVHDMLDRLKSLAEQSSNGTYDDEVDRAGLQQELEQIRTEVGRIADTANYNGITLFQDLGFAYERGTKSGLMEAPSEIALAEAHEHEGIPFEEEFIYEGADASANLTLNDVLTEGKGALQNIIYTETVYDFETTKTPSSDVTYSGADAEMANTLKTQIVPQVVSAVLARYPAFNYLDGSSIGIGLRLYSDSGSSVLASVGVSTSYLVGDGTATGKALSYTLSVNIGKANLSTEEGRSALERTIAHEMIHAFMDEATTAGMTGITPGGRMDSEKFPLWFIEGMAQTASGPGGWVSALGLNERSTLEDVKAALNGADKLSSGTNASHYGTGYLACMYLGYLATDETVNLDGGPTAVAAGLSNGLSKMLSEIISGKSLQDVVMGDSRYESLEEFESNFWEDGAEFVKKLLEKSYFKDGFGGLIGGDLSKSDPVDNGDRPGVKLFELDTGSTSVKNDYPDDITVLSGGGRTVTGKPPVGGIEDPGEVEPVTYAMPFTVTGGTAGEDYSYDETTGVLKILKSNVNLAIGGGTTAEVNGRIEVADGVKNAKLNLSGVNIDMSAQAGNNAGILLGNDSEVTLTLTGTNTIKGGKQAAGIQVPAQYEKLETVSPGAKLTIDGEGTLEVVGGTDGYKGGAGIGAAWAEDAINSSITIKSGTIKATGGMGGAGIGGSEGGNIGDIVIEGGTINALGGEHGAGIGGGGWVATYPNGPQHVKSITITGGDITASSKFHGTGIGGGCHGTCGEISIGTVGASDGNITINVTGGNDGSALGAGWAGDVTGITINSGTITATGGTNGSGIGGGFQGSSGKIQINGGNITATGQTNSCGIGSGRSGSVAGVEITGGTITAKGGWTNDGGNIGGYTDKANKEKAGVTIDTSKGLTIKAGSGEGKYITTGSVDKETGKPSYALSLKYVADKLKEKESVELSFPITLTAKGKTSGQEYTWTGIQHNDIEDAWVWMLGGEDVTLTFGSGEGAKSIDLKFFEERGMWRTEEDEATMGDPPKEPTFVGSSPVVAEPSVPAEEKAKTGIGGGIDLLIGPEVGENRENILTVPRFYFSIGALNLQELDISTQAKAIGSMSLIQNAINRVSSIRGEYGSLQNRLEHTIDNLGISLENLTDAESRIRDTDMAEEMMKYTKNNILIQSAQAMLAQASNLPQQALQLLQ